VVFLKALYVDFHKLSVAAEKKKKSWTEDEDFADSYQFVDIYMINREKWKTAGMK